MSYQIEHPKRGLSGTRVDLSEEEGAGYHETTVLGDELRTVTKNITHKKVSSAPLRAHGLIRFDFHLSGDRSIGERAREPLRLHQPLLLIYYQPQALDLIETVAPAARHCSVDISVRPSFLTELQSIVRSNRFEPIRLPMNATILGLVVNLVDNPYLEPALRLLHTEAVSLQLLCVSLQQLAWHGAHAQHPHSDRELRCLHDARRYLEKHLAPAPTISQVARAVGISQTLLKQGFKSLFGETLYQFSVRCRMERAFQLLQQDCLPIAKTASAVGYNASTTFATAFRRRFGMSPKDVRPQRPR